MLEKPDLDEERIVACLREHYGLNLRHLEFLPLGADRHSAVYRGVAGDDIVYFIKLRRGAFDKISVTLPHYLNEQGIEQIITPRATLSGQLWTSLDLFTVVLYPFVEGRDVYEIGLSDCQWVELGAAFKRIHSVAVPPALRQRIRQETYPPQWREVVRTYLARIATDRFDDPIAAQLAELLHIQRAVITDLVERAEQLAAQLKDGTQTYVLCHSDLHGANIHICSDGTFFIVDWDAPILAPKERDLMSIGGGLMGTRHSVLQEETQFYRGYGPTQVDEAALAYYRFERIIQDIAEFCEQIFVADGLDADRAQALHYMASNFRPNGTIERAYAADRNI